MHSKSPNLDHLWIFGCLANATQTNIIDKFQSRLIPSVFVGYSLSQKGYKLYNLHTKTFFVSHDVIFHESIFPFQHPTPHKTSFLTFPLPWMISLYFLHHHHHYLLLIFPILILLLLTLFPIFIQHMLLQLNLFVHLQHLLYLI